MEKPKIDLEVTSNGKSLGSIHMGTEAGTCEKLALLIGEKVTVWTGVGIRNSFDSQLSVNGTLEKHPTKDAYRIVLSDGTYCYFRPIDVLMIGEKFAGFKDGSKAVIELKFGDY